MIGAGERLVEQNKTVWAGLMKNLGQPFQFFGQAPAADVAALGRGKVAVDRVGRADARPCAGNQQASLCQHKGLANGARVGGFAAAVRPGEDGDRCAGGEVHLVGDNARVRGCGTQAQRQVEIIASVNLAGLFFARSNFRAAQRQTGRAQLAGQARRAEKERKLGGKRGQWRAVDACIAGQRVGNRGGNTLQQAAKIAEQLVLGRALAVVFGLVERGDAAQRVGGPIAKQALQQRAARRKALRADRKQRGGLGAQLPVEVDAQRDAASLTELGAQRWQLGGKAGIVGRGTGGG